MNANQNSITGPAAITEANRVEAEARKHVGFGYEALVLAKLPASVLTTKQVKTFGPKEFTYGSDRYRITAQVRYDDSCGNGHNSFAITADIKRLNRTRWVDDSCGMCHKDVAKNFPELAPLLKWHLCSSDGPMHYLANTRYHIQQDALDYARSTAIWPEASNGELIDLLYKGGLDDKLQERLPALMREFKAAVESLGLVY